MRRHGRDTQVLQTIKASVLSVGEAASCAAIMNENREIYRVVWSEPHELVLLGMRMERLGFADNMVDAPDLVPGYANVFCEEAPGSYVNR